MSSFAGETGESRQPQDVLALGRRLVEELQLEPSVDTLGRWMAHHLAELIIAAENVAEPSLRRQATDRAVTTILRVWEHRSTCRQVNPLADLVPVLSILRVLGAEPPPWTHFSAGKPGDAARQIYDLLRRLAICLSLWEFGSIDNLHQALARAGRTARWQSAEESEIVHHLSAWADTLPDATQARRRRWRRTTKDASQQNEKLDFAEVARQILDELDATLTELRESSLKQSS